MINKALKITGVIAVAVCLFGACRNEKKRQTPNTVSVVKTEIDTVTGNAEPTSNLPNAEPDFPASANKIEDLIPQYFDIDMEASGDLNGDGLEDNVLVLIDTRDTTALRPTLVVLKVAGAYKVDTKSFTVLEPKYREDGFQNYDFEEVSIDKNGELTFTQQAMGPNGNLESTFKYINNELVFTDLSSFNMGAGGQTGLKLDLIKGVFEQTDIDTMKEDMPSKTTRRKYKLPKVLFAESDPRAMMIRAFEDNGN